MIVASFLVASGGTANFTSPKFLIVLAISAPVFILPTVVLFIVFFLRRNRRMEITESGLTLYDVTGTHRILWNEARLFAIYMGRKGQPAIYYELSSTKDIVRWIWLRKYTKFNTEVPTISLEEYNGQMQALLELIAAKTSLQLYDLREPVKKQA